MAYEAVIIDNDRVFVHPRGNGDVIPGSSDTYDYRNLQKGIKWAQEQGRKLVLLGKTYYINRRLQVDKYNLYFNLDGNYATIKTTNSDPFVLIDRPVPTDNSDANVMINTIFNVENLKLEGSSTQVGIRPGPTYGDGEGSYFKHIKGKGLKLVMDLEFCLNADIIKPSAVNCLNGWKVQFGQRWGGNNSNSQSNNVRIYKPRFYAPANAQYGIYYFGCSGGVIDEPIIEGFKTDVGIYCDGNSSTVVKTFNIINGYHYECVNGSTTAALKVRLAGGKASLDGFYGQYPTIVADMGATIGYMEFEFKNMAYAVPLAGKLFNNEGCTWEGEFSTYQSGAIKNSNFASLVKGVPVSLCGGDSCGSNRFKINEIPR